MGSNPSVPTIWPFRPAVKSRDSQSRHPSSSLGGATIGLWCNGSTGALEACGLGSKPGRPTNFPEVVELVDTPDLGSGAVFACSMQVRRLSSGYRF